MTSSPVEDRGRIPGPGAALLLLAVVALFVAVGIPLQILLGEAGLLVSQVVFLLLPVLVFLRRGGFDFRMTLALRTPSLAHVGGGVLLLAGGLQLALFLAWVQSLLVPVPVEYLAEMAGSLGADSVGRFLWLILIAAALPAVAEEVLFRGVVLSAFRQRLPTGLAIVAAGLIFGLFHLTPQTAFRFLPTAWLGIVLGWAVVLSRSLPLGMMLHFVNNATVLAMISTPVVRSELPGRVTQMEAPVALLFTGGILFLIGLRILRTAPARGDGF